MATLLDSQSPFQDEPRTEGVTWAHGSEARRRWSRAATSNIGRAIASAFGAEGAHVVVSGRSVERGTEVVERIRAGGGRADFVAAELDGSQEASRLLASQATRVLGGRIDILVNNAGIFPSTTTATTDETTFDEVYAVNVKAPYFLTGSGRAGHGRRRWRRDHQPRFMDRPARRSRAPSTAPPRARWKP